jgi:RNA polymerase sigma factor (sigma-70 family)
LTQTPPTLDRNAQNLLRELAPQVLGAVMRRYRDFPAAEDAVQEALIVASQRWPTEGLPENPRGWLIRVAARRVTDHIRTETARRHREELVVSLIPPDEQMVLAADDENARRLAAEHDDALELLFMCCHPSLSPTSAIALTLRAVGGLTTFEIAKAFLVPEATMAQRISRAKQTIKDSGLPLGRLSEAEEEAEDASELESETRLSNVKHVLYLIFNEGYSASTGPDLLRTDLSDEAIRLTRMLLRSLPDDGEVHGLLALMLLTDARREARTGPDGELIPLDKQDRSRWNQDAIREGVDLVTSAIAKGSVGPYQLQAAIAAVHDEAKSAEETDWQEILGLYTVLLRIGDNPIVSLNHAVAVAMVHGPKAGLERLDELSKDPRLKDNHRLEAAKAHLQERAGNHRAAISGYLRAAEQTTSLSERNYLVTHAARLREICDGRTHEP